MVFLNNSFDSRRDWYVVELRRAQIAAHFPRKFSAEGIYCLGDVN